MAQKVRVLFTVATLVIAMCGALLAQKAPSVANTPAGLNAHIPVADALQTIRDELGRQTYYATDCAYHLTSSGANHDALWYVEAPPCRKDSLNLNFKFECLIEIKDLAMVSGDRYGPTRWAVALWNDRRKSTGCGRDHTALEWDREEDARAFAAAVNRMIWEHSPEAAQAREARQREWADFQQKAHAWREAGAKVQEMSDDARREKLLAEDAIKEKKIESAISHYEAGLRLQPLWPDGWFNLALLYGEMHDYGDAADRMKHYLELMPNAPDAAAAKDKILLWEAKEKEAEQ